MDVPDLKDLILYHTRYFTVHGIIPPEVFTTLEHTPNLHCLSRGHIQWGATDICLPRITTLSNWPRPRARNISLRTLNSFPNFVELIVQCTDNVKLTDAWEPIPGAVLLSSLSTLNLPVFALQSRCSQAHHRNGEEFFSHFPTLLSLSPPSHRLFHPTDGTV